MASPSHETVRLRLKKTPSSPGGSSSGAYPRMNGEFVAAMEDVLDLYGEPYDPIGQWCALTRPPPKCWPRSEHRMRLERKRYDMAETFGIANIPDRRVEMYLVATNWWLEEGRSTASW